MALLVLGLFFIIMRRRIVDAAFYPMMKLSQSLVLLVLAIYLTTSLAPLNFAIALAVLCAVSFVLRLTVFIRYQPSADEAQLPFPFLVSLASRAPPVS
jgi:hypothetical protein